MAWLLKGESSKTLDATSRSLASLNLSSAVLKFQSLANDTFTWTADTTAATGAGTIIPDFGQVVELYWDSTRKFRGHVTSVKVGMRQIAVEISGPWWWMERTNLTEVQTDATGAISRFLGGDEVIHAALIGGGGGPHQEPAQAHAIAGLLEDRFELCPFLMIRAGNMNIGDLGRVMRTAEHGGGGVDPSVGGGRVDVHAVQGGQGRAEAAGGVRLTRAAVERQQA
ncbi:MAG: hypothetical protein WCO57_03755 [Verrucomicrobiota bacterium]